MSDTIAAIATARGPSAIGILRLSGDSTCSVLDRVFRPMNGRPMSSQPYRTMVLGSLLDRDGQLLDNALCVLFGAGSSYTGEISAEIHTHGSPVVLDAGLSAMFAAGARQATGGEFTRRAFLNGRLDLMQAEAVVDLIDAETVEAAHHAAAQLSGTLSRAVETVYQDILSVMSRFYAVVDYPDEDIADLERGELRDTLRRSRLQLEELVASFSRGQIVKNGLPTVLLGKPNVGKSSLLNALLGYERAIVTDIAGTTRDTVEEKLALGNILLRLMDTAGLRNSEDTVEMLGVARSRAAAGNASLALLVLDGSRPLDAEDEEAMLLATAASNAIAVVNKSDLGCCIDLAALQPRFTAVLSLSARDGSGIKELCNTIEKLYAHEHTAAGEMLTNARQVNAASRALQAVEAAEESLFSGMTPDVVLTECEHSLEALNELTGNHVRDDLVETIFSRFCVGK
ncbi:MAG: tRNA uridine-5-carboxymethylaminomethyl(34) synthesis GTPase MnmE [Oscillospiraceae bacterium]|nr:tRNA uridine-5-carboxymethylaminomethyl(34) synthesis GTPase MnmE [Oscillospiraceae bacterium]